jgi:hypothetical protein
MYINQVIALAEKHTLPQAAPQSLSLSRTNWNCAVNLLTGSFSSAYRHRIGPIGNEHSLL